MEMLRPFRCKVCFYAHWSFHVLQSHQKRHKVKYTRAIPRRSYHVKHIRKCGAHVKRNQNHHGIISEPQPADEVFFQCVFCDDCFVGKTHLTEHLKNEHRFTKIKSQSYLSLVEFKRQHRPSQPASFLPEFELCVRSQKQNQVVKSTHASVKKLPCNNRLEVTRVYTETCDVSFYRCNDCLVEFLSMSAFRVHRCKSMNEEPETCDDHQNHNFDNNAACSPIRTVAGSYQCPYCQLLYFSQRLLLAHLPKCTQTQGTNFTLFFRCKECPREFLSKKSVQAHTCSRIRARIKDKPAKCDGQQSPFQVQSCPSTKETPGNSPSPMQVNISCHAYKCPNCSKYFSRENTLQEHIKTHNASPSKTHVKGTGGHGPSGLGLNRALGKSVYSRFHLQCRYCPKVLRTRSLLRTHMEETHQCSSCQQWFADAHSLNLHRETHLNEKTYRCKRCKMELATEAKLQAHMELHNKSKHLECDECHSCFSETKFLERHIRIYHKREKLYNYQCEHCKFGFFKQEGLEKHLKKFHTERGCTNKPPYHCKKKSQCDKKTHLCEVCGEHFDTLGRLKLHVRTHRIHQCEQCKNCFAMASSLKHHMRSHNTEKPYKCSTCGKSFKILHALTKHTETHFSDKKYPCPLCGKEYIFESSLKAHVRICKDTTRVKERSCQCEYCGVVFKDLSRLNAHIRTWHTKEKPYQCKYCNKRFSSSATLRGHIRTHTKEKPYSCDVCQRAFADWGNLKSHKRTHTKEKPYSCKLCGAKFARSNNVTIHMKVHKKSKV